MHPVHDAMSTCSPPSTPLRITSGNVARSPVCNISPSKTESVSEWDSLDRTCQFGSKPGQETKRAELGGDIKPRLFFSGGKHFAPHEEKWKWLNLLSSPNSEPSFRPGERGDFPAFVYPPELASTLRPRYESMTVLGEAVPLTNSRTKELCQGKMEPKAERSEARASERQREAERAVLLLRERDRKRRDIPSEAEVEADRDISAKVAPGHIWYEREDSSSKSHQWSASTVLAFDQMLGSAHASIRGRDGEIMAVRQGKCVDRNRESVADRSSYRDAGAACDLRRYAFYLLY